MATTKRKKKSKKRETLARQFVNHLASIGFTNRLCLFIMALLTGTIFGGFYLALKSIQYAYVGSLLCYTACITPMDTVLGIVLREAVKKSAAENTSETGCGIKFAQAMAQNFGADWPAEQSEISVESPPI